MKPTVIFAGALATAVQASWSFRATCPSGSTPQEWPGSSNKGCTTMSNCNSGSYIYWDRGVFDSCVVRLYKGQPCRADQEIGSSASDWTHKLTQTVGAFGVTNC